VQDAVYADPIIPRGYDESQDHTRPSGLETLPPVTAARSPAPTASAAPVPSIQDIVSAVISLMNQGGVIKDKDAAAQVVAASLQGQTARPNPAPAATPAPTTAPAGKSRIEDILKF
jgi:hypothetical protein